MQNTDDAFHRLVEDLDYPMFVVTAAAGDERSGCLVGFLTQASIEPPRLIVLLSKQNRTYSVAEGAALLAVNFLHSGNLGLAALFGEQTGDEVDKFRLCEWVAGPHGVPLLGDTRGWALGTILARLDSGDHVAHLMAVEEAASHQPDRGFLSFSAVKEIPPGHPA
jgi:flavin reductase (DIM6/NTAB) family NADH-FMN oxidoreductase RutF